ncbi:MAG: ATP-binding cassette domain-containing protein [Alphaproteobacteria bacterium]|nr:ATP-binding cassette domain-containing protein [Alphaproteobacteria bacterium]
MKSISLINISFSYPGMDALFDDLSAVFRANQIVAIVGDNGAGKSTLLKIIAGQITPDAGRIVRDATVAVLPQMPRHGDKSGGQRQMAELLRVFDSGADILLLDEPTNNLDVDARHTFYDMLAQYNGGVIIVSHDRDLLRQVDCIVELSGGKLTVYGGNYDFYVDVRNAARQSLASQYAGTQKRIAELNRTMTVAQNTRQHHEAKQKKDIGTARRSRIASNALRGKSQETEAKKRNIIQKKIDEQLARQQDLSLQLRDDVIKIPMPSKPFYSKDLVQMNGVTFGYGKHNVLHDFNLTIYGGGRIHLMGPNGCGKSTLLKLITGALHPNSGTIKTFGRIAYLNQDLSLLNPNKSIVENIMDVAGILQHDAHAIAANFGFRGNASRRRVGSLSGGELLKATMAAVLGSQNQPDLLILDEPTNNLDIKSIAILESALRQYRGAVLLVSHDTEFVQNVAVGWDKIEI